MKDLIADAVADLFPLISGDDYDALKADIKEHGVREPITLHDGRILDGRNRYAVCRDLNVDCPSCEWDGVGSKVAFVISKNLHRRHLSSGQRAALAAEILPMLEAEASVREHKGKSSDNSAGGRGKTLGKELPRVSDDGKATSQAAKLTGTNRQYVADAKKLKADAPEEFEQVRSGAKTLPEAKRSAATTPRWEQGATSLPKTKDHSDADSESDALFHLKQWWKKGSKRDQTTFFSWAKDNKK